MLSVDMLHVREESVAAGDRIARLLRRRAEAFDRLARRAHRRLEPTVVHDLRVLLRRIRAAVWVARRIAAVPRGLRGELRRLGRALGERRLLDVAVADAAAFGLDADPVRVRREEAGRAVAKLLRPGRRAAVAALLRAASEAAAQAGRDEPLPRHSGGSGRAGGLGEGLAGRAARLEEALRRAPAGKREMHALRIEAKKARYVLEAIGRDGEILHPLQQRIGRAHDLEVLQKLLGPDEAAAREERRASTAARRMMRKAVARAVQELTP